MTQKPRSSARTTGVLAYGTTWVNAMDCRFEDNQVGFRFNAEGTVITHTQYANNEFFHNGTAVLLPCRVREPDNAPRAALCLCLRRDGDVPVQSCRACGRSRERCRRKHRQHALFPSCHVSSSCHERLFRPLCAEYTISATVIQWKLRPFAAVLPCFPNFSLCFRQRKKGLHLGAPCVIIVSEKILRRNAHTPVFGSEKEM